MKQSSVDVWCTAVRSSTGTQSMFTTSPRSRNRVSRIQSRSNSVTGTRTILATPLLREGVRYRSDLVPSDRGSSLH